MYPVRHRITLSDGVEVELLFTPSLYGVARRRGIVIEVEDPSDAVQVVEAYTKVVYLAAINAHEVRRMDDPALGEFPYRYIDFVEWAARDGKGFARIIEAALLALTGKGVSDYAGEAVKKKSPSPGTTAPSRRSLSGLAARLRRRPR